MRQTGVRSPAFPRLNRWMKEIALIETEQEAPARCPRCSGRAVAPIADEAGAPAAALVELVTERSDISGADRRRLELRTRVAEAGGRALALYAADRLCTLRQLDGRARTKRMRGALAADLWNLERDMRMLTQAGAPPFF